MKNPMNKLGLKSLLLLLFLVFLPTKTFAEETAHIFRWNLQPDKIVKYETVIISASKIPIPKAEESEDNSNLQVEKELKEYFGENYQNGVLSNRTTQNTMTVLKKVAENRINLKTLIVEEKTSAQQDFIKNGAALKKGLVTANFMMESDGSLLPPETSEKQTTLKTKQNSFLQHLLFSLPEKMRKPGDTEKFEVPCASFKGFPVLRHKKTGSIKFHKIEKNKQDQDIAILVYNYYERMDVQDTPEPKYSKVRTAACKYNGQARFNLSAGRWESIDGELKTLFQQDKAIEMRKKDISKTISTVTIQIKLTDKNPPKEISQEDYFNALKASNPEIFEDTQQTLGQQGQKPP